MKPVSIQGENRMLKAFRSVILALALPGLIALAVITAPAAYAQDDAAPLARTHAEAVKTPQGKFIQDLGDRAISIIADKSATVDQRSDRFRAILSYSFDLKTIGRFVIGRNWNVATPEQQKEYMHLFEELVIKSYGDRLT